MLTAIFGRSSVGKTTLVRELARREALDGRYCGDIVRSAAAQLGHPIEDLPLDEHARIDAETRGWCVEHPGGLVEGRFLDQVLSTLEIPFCLIEVVASESVRVERWASRLDRPSSLEDVAAFDRNDDAFRVRAYGGRARVAPNFTLDTSSSSLDECLTRLAAWRREPKLD